MEAIPFDKRSGKIWFNGEPVNWTDVKVHVLSHGLHYASCVFEGERIYDGEIFKLQEHTERLFHSAYRMGFKIPYDQKIINQACKDIVAIPHKQVRLEVVVPQNVKGIRERIDDTQGNSVLENKPIPILVDFFGKGKHARIGHKHFVLACVASEFVFDDTELNIVWIPKKEWIKLVDTKQKGDDRYNKLELFGILLNPDNEVTSLPSSKETYANNIFNNYKLNNVVPRHSSNIEILKAGKVPPSKRTAIYELVDKMIAKKTAILKGQFFNDWIGDEILLEKLKKHIENKTSRLAFTKATYLLSNRSLRAFVYHILHEVVEDNPYAQLIHVVIVHATYDDQTEWDTKKLAIVSTKINKWLKAWNTEYKKNVRVEYSPVSISRPKPPMDDSSIDAEAETARKVVI